MAKRKVHPLERLEGCIKELKALVEPAFKACPACGKPNRFKGMKRKAKFWPYCTKKCKEAEERKTNEEFAKMIETVEAELQDLEKEADADNEIPPEISSIP